MSNFNSFNNQLTFHSYSGRGSQQSGSQSLLLEQQPGVTPGGTGDHPDPSLKSSTSGQSAQSPNNNVTSQLVGVVDLSLQGGQSGGQSLSGVSENATSQQVAQHAAQQAAVQQAAVGGGGNVPGGNESSGLQNHLHIIQVQPKRRNRPGQRFGAKKRSWVWNCFTQDSANANIAVCELCGRVIVRLASDKGSPKKLIEHLRTHKVTKDDVLSNRPIVVGNSGYTFIPRNQPFEDGHPGDSLVHESQAGSQSVATPQQQAPGVQVPFPQSNMEEAGSPSEVAGTSPTPGRPIFNSSRRFVSDKFDNSPYTTTKFHKHLLTFLQENELLFAVLKSHSFLQLIYDLRSNSVSEVLELGKLYSSVIEVSRFARPENEAEES